MDARKPRTLNQERSDITQNQLYIFYRRHKALCEFHHFDAIISYDETGFHGYSVEMNGIRVYFSVEHRNVAFRITPSKRDHITLLPLIGIDLNTGVPFSIDPLFVTPSKFVNTNPAASQLDPANQRDVIHDSIEVLRGTPIRMGPPPGVPKPKPFPRVHAANSSGNVNGAIILNWMKEHAIPSLRTLGYTKEAHKVLMYGDQHESHKGVGLNEFLESEGIWHRYIPPHGTQHAQGLDADNGPLSVMKREGEKLITSWSVHLKARGSQLSVEDFPFVIQPAFEKSMQAKYILHAFKTCGLHPINPDAVLLKFKTGESFEELEKIFESKAPEPPSPSDSPVPVASQPSPEQFSDTLSDPSSNRSPVRKTGRREQHPYSLTINPRADAFNFDAVSLEDSAAAVLHKAFLASHVISRGRGLKLGKEGDIFSAEDIARQAERKRVAKQAKIDRQAVKRSRKRAAVQALEDKKEELVDQVKQSKKEKKAAQKELHVVELQLAKSEAKRDGRSSVGILTRTQERLLLSAREKSTGTVKDQCTLCRVHYTQLEGSGIEWRYDCQGCHKQFCGACCSSKAWRQHEQSCLEETGSEGDDEEEDLEGEEEEEDEDAEAEEEEKDEDEQNEEDVEEENEEEEEEEDADVEEEKEVGDNEEEDWNEDDAEEQNEGSSIESAQTPPLMSSKITEGDDYADGCDGLPSELAFAVEAQSTHEGRVAKLAFFQRLHTTECTPGALVATQSNDAGSWEDDRKNVGENNSSLPETHVAHSAADPIRRSGRRRTRQRSWSD
jgi:hypothetical protein